MGQPSLCRLVALVVLTSWLAPGISATAVGLHVGASHHHDRGLATKLAMGFVHGHAHEVAEPGHDHPAACHGGAPALPWFAGSAGWTLAVTAMSSPTSLATPATPARRAPPDSLFYSHCALLL